MSTPARRDAGFTTVEILVAVALLSLISAAVAGYMRAPPPAVRVMTEARHLAAVLQRLRADAITTQDERRFVIDADRRTYGVEGGRPVQIPDDMAISADIAAGSRRREGVVRFFPTGTSSGAAVRLSAGGTTVAVLVNWATGAVRVEEQP